MIVVFSGPPGSGKGTQAQRVSKVFDLEYISTGNILRSEIALGSPLGRSVKDVIGSGAFISDKMVLEVLEAELRRKPSKALLLDGVPRTLAQAYMLDDLLAELGLPPVSIVIQFDIDDDVLVERIRGRFSCASCGASYHKKNNAPKIEGVCDYCGSKDFIIRQDDREEVLKKRLEVYYLETLPILGYYKSVGALRRVDASLTPDKVSEEVISIIKKKSEKGE